MVVGGTSGWPVMGDGDLGRWVKVARYGGGR